MSEPRSDEDQPDHEWLEARELGKDISHVPAHKREPYEKLGAMIGSGMAPSPGFRRRVLDAIDAEEAKTTETPGVMRAPEAMAEAEAAARKKAAEAMAESIAASVRERAEAELARKRKEREQQQRRRRLAVVGALAAAAAVIAVQLRRDPVEPVGQVVSLNSEIKGRPSERPVRGGHDTPQAADSAPQQATVGNTLVVNAETVGPAELRVYGGDLKERLYTRCNESEPGDCTIKRDGNTLLFSLDVLLKERGKVDAVVCLGKKLPASLNELNADLEAAAAAGIECKPLKPSTIVR